MKITFQFLNLLFWCGQLGFLVTNADEFARETAEDRWRETLVHTTIFFRHGARAPLHFIPNDFENRLETWPDGLGGLTELGITQMRNLGREVRARYDDFVDEIFSPRQLYARSSSYDRTLLSAQVFLSGFYEKQRNKSEYNFVDVPVHTKPIEEDKELYFYVPCPAADDVYSKLMYENHKYIKLAENLVDVLTYLSKMGGFSKVPLPLHEFIKLYDPLKCEQIHGRKWPEWMNESMFEEIERNYDTGSYLLVDDDKLKGLRVGPLYDEIVTRLNKLNEGLADQKMYLYSCHDTTIGGLLATLGMEADKYPQFGAILTVELHKNATSNWLRFFYNEGLDDTDTFQEVFPKNCLWPCTVDKFVEFVTPYIPHNWDAECGFEWAVRREQVVNNSGSFDEAHDAVGQITVLGIQAVTIITLVLIIVVQVVTLRQQHGIFIINK
ncbi:unnamed protein product [Bursaphelenchus okinawaensis]|uniref:Acid phosphatase n=1 Tax=Bursaphelenchus okinawaensis TaxID=465554 RepID=A0A811KZ45_9BILA|nr:unnamed protein product [Bursaphelenchus okinawaensis]CAG9114920.1 unnamed protein product [Bursaphelenchus okinawaensis]